ncbi:hypothetical protein GCM10010517_39390 [Streptosporangium fragile]|uniref:PH domain-containing protein n=1 Tax=Streptosporangium fragile TaxID=46186 RepID=A0ABN3VZT7_9ACTN
MVGAAGNYTALDKPVPLIAVAAVLIARAGWLVLGPDSRGLAVALTVVLAMIWAAVSVGALLSSRGTDKVIPGPAGTGLTLRFQYEHWDWFAPWFLVVRKDDGWLTREWDVEGCRGRKVAAIPEVTWTDPARPSLDGQVLLLDPETGRPSDPDFSC